MRDMRDYFQSHFQQRLQTRRLIDVISDAKRGRGLGLAPVTDRSIKAALQVLRKMGPVTVDNPNEIPAANGCVCSKGEIEVYNRSTYGAQWCQETGNDTLTGLDLATLESKNDINTEITIWKRMRGR